MADITVKTQSLPNAQVGVPYEAGIAATGNATAVTAVSVTSGALPPGLSIQASDIRVTGTPTKSGTFTFKVTLTDTAGAVQSGNLTISVVYPVVTDILAQTPAAQIAKTWAA